jgi:hypothetical protein
LASCLSATVFVHSEILQKIKIKRDQPVQFLSQLLLKIKFVIASSLVVKVCWPNHIVIREYCGLKMTRYLHENSLTECLQRVWNGRLLDYVGPCRESRQVANHPIYLSSIYAPPSNVGVSASVSRSRYRNFLFLVTARLQKTAIGL